MYHSQNLFNINTHGELMQSCDLVYTGSIPKLLALNSFS